jgi:hypothetical protein
MENQVGHLALAVHFEGQPRVHNFKKKSFTTPTWSRRSASRQTTWREMPNAYATPSFAASAYLSAPASSKPAARPSSVPGSRLKQSGMFWTVAGPALSLPPLLPPQPPIRGLLGGSPGRLIPLLCRAPPFFSSSCSFRERCLNCISADGVKMANTEKENALQPSERKPLCRDVTRQTGALPVSRAFQRLALALRRPSRVRSEFGQ